MHKNQPKPQWLSWQSATTLITAALFVSAAIGIVGLISDLAETPSAKRISIELAMILPVVAFLARNHRWRRLSG